MAFEAVPFVDPFLGGWTYSKPPDPSGIGLAPQYNYSDMNNFTNVVNPMQYTPVSPDLVNPVGVTFNDNIVQAYTSGSQSQSNNGLLFLLMLLMMEK